MSEDSNGSSKRGDSADKKQPKLRLAGKNGVHTKVGTGEPEGPITNLSIRQINKSLYSNPLELDLSNVTLQDLNQLNLALPRMSDLLRVDLSANRLENIDWLNGLQQLKKITATNNHIRLVFLELPRLQELDIRNNFIEKMPALSDLPNLRTLIIKSNNIEELKLVTSFQNYQNLRMIDVRNNKIKMTDQQIDKLSHKLTKFKVLEAFNMESNNVDMQCKPYHDLILALPESIQMINNQRRVVLCEQIKANSSKKERLQKQQKRVNQSRLEDSKVEEDSDQERKTEEVQEGVGPNEKPVSQIKTKKILLPTLMTMVYNLGQALSQPIKALSYIKQVYSQTDMIKKMQSSAPSQAKFNEVFLDKGDDDGKLDNNEADEYIDQFMQQAQLLVDNNDELRDIILTVLAILTIIHTRDFGVKCFQTLRDLMVAEEALREQVRHHVDKQIIQQLNTLPPKDIPIGLLNGLTGLVSDPHLNCTNLMAGLFKDFFPKWLSEIKEQIIYKTQSFSNDNTEEQINAILNLMCASIKGDQDNVNQTVVMQLHEDLAQIYLQTSQDKSRYLPLVDCLTQIAKMSERAASEFLMSGIHYELMQDTKLTYYRYSKQQQDFQISDREQKKHAYHLFAAQIKLIASLINADVDNRGTILWDSLTKDLLSVVTHPRTDPILLTSICYLVNQVMNAITDGQDTDDRINPGEEMKQRIEKMQYCDNLLPFLGFVEDLGDQNKFMYLLNQIRDLHSGENNIEEKDPDVEELLDKLDDPIIHELFIEIIHIIQFFCQGMNDLETEKKKHGDLNPIQAQLYKQYGKVCEKLDEASREAALFNCLRIPDDGVKLAVVQCLYYVPIEQIDKGEYRDLITQMYRIENIGVGQIELVLSIIFQNFCRIVRETSMQARESVETFKTDFIDQAIQLSIQFLTMNQKREVMDREEEVEKYTLSLAIINFLKYVSKDNQIRDKLSEIGRPENTLSNVLFQEQTFTRTNEFKLVPVEIETTDLGNHFADLKSCISMGYLSLEPYNFVSFRVIHQMANLLQLDKPKDYYNPVDLDTQDSEEVLIQEYAAKFKGAFSYEKLYWNDYNINRFNDAKEAMDKAATEAHMKHHQEFTQWNGNKELLHFLTGKRNDYENWLRENQDPAIQLASSQVKHPIFGRGLIYDIQNKIRKMQEESLMMKDGEKKNKSSSVSVFEESKGGTKTVKKKDSYQKMISTFQYQSLGNGFKRSSIDMYQLMRAETMMMKRLRFREKASEGIKNAEQRALSISAFLRCLFASIESAPDTSFFEDAIKNIQSDDFFTQVAQLCSSTGWLTASIGTKYIQVMRYAIRVDSTDRLEQNSNIYKYDILSIVISRILGLLEPKIKNENQNQELEVDDQVVLCHIAVLCNQMVTQSTLFDWTYIERDPTDKREPKDKREVREQLISYQLSKLFPLETVELMIEALFHEIKTVQDRLHGLIPEREFSTRFQLYFNAGNRLIEHTKKFLSRYLAHCSDNKYSVNRHIMYNVVIMEKKHMRNSFIDEILEGANQILVAEHLFRKMPIKDLLSYQHSIDVKNWINANTAADKDQERFDIDNTRMNQAQLLLKHIKTDIYLGERIHLSQPMNVHIQSLTDNKKFGMNPDMYYCMNVVLTNHGVYLIDDVDQSWYQNHDPKHENQFMGGDKGKPKNVQSFNYKSIKRLAYGNMMEQRITIKVDFGIEEWAEQPWWSHLTTAEYPQGQTEEVLDTTAQKKQQAKSKKKQVQQGPKNNEFYITFIVPNMIDCIQMRELMSEALAYANVDQEEELEHKLIYNDYTTQGLMFDAIKQMQIKKTSHYSCPLCEKDRTKEDCKCNHHIAYAYKLKEMGTLKLISESTQRGGTTRLLSTKLDEHIQHLAHETKPRFQEVDTSDQPIFGILLMSTTDFYFFKEKPGYWHETVDAEFDWVQFRKLSTRQEIQIPGMTEKESSTIMQKIYQMYSKAEMIKIKMQDITNLRIVTTRVPALELQYLQSGHSTPKKVIFSMLSDYNVQETLMALKRLKRQGQLAFKKAQKYQAELNQVSQNRSRRASHSKIDDKSQSKQRRTSVMISTTNY